MHYTTGKVIAEFVDNLDFLSVPFHEHQVSGAVNSFIKEKNLENLPLEWLAEAMAFDFVPNYSNKNMGWGTYYGPMWVMSNGDGTATESPSIRLVTPEIIDYWEERSRTAKHPIIRLRYADLVWDFSKTVTQKAPHFSIAHVVIDSTIEIARNRSHKFETDIITKLERALSLAIRINDTQRVERLRDAIIEYEDNVAEDTKAGLWGFSFDLLIIGKMPISSGIRDKLIGDLEDRLARLADPVHKENLDPWAAKGAALRLAKYYRSAGQNEDSKRVLLKFGTAFEIASESAAPLQASAWLQHVHSVYLEYGGLRDEAEKLAVKIKELGPKVIAEMKPISAEIKITQEEMTNFINSIVDDDLEKSLIRTAVHFVPKKDKIEDQLKDLSKNAPISFLIPRQIQDHEGRPVSFIGSLEDDLTGHIVHQSSQNMQISSIFLRPVLQEAISRFALTPEKIVEYLSRSTLFTDEKKTMLFEGIKAYIDGNHLVAIHLLIPQVEAAFRRLVEHTGGAVLKPGRGGGLHLKTLDELLRDERVVTVFGDDMSLYFRILLTDQRGWNLRNDVCHGIIPAIAFSSKVSDRVLHVLLCLALVRDKKEESDESDE